MKRADFPAPREEITVTHFLVAADIAETARFYSDVLGGEIVYEGTPTLIRLANSWVIVSTGGGPTPDKPDVVLEAPSRPNVSEGFMNIRVADIRAVYDEWREKGAEFLTPPLDNHGYELRCYVRDPDGRIIEVGQATGMLDVFEFDD